MYNFSRTEHTKLDELSVSDAPLQFTVTMGTWWHHGLMTRWWWKAICYCVSSDSGYSPICVLRLLIQIRLCPCRSQPVLQTISLINVSVTFTNISTRWKNTNRWDWQWTQRPIRNARLRWGRTTGGRPGGGGGRRVQGRPGRGDGWARSDLDSTTLRSRTALGDWGQSLSTLPRGSWLGRGHCTLILRRIDGRRGLGGAGGVAAALKFRVISLRFTLACIDAKSTSQSGPTNCVPCWCEILSSISQVISKIPGEIFSPINVLFPPHQSVNTLGSITVIKNNTQNEQQKVHATKLL